MFQVLDPVNQTLIFSAVLGLVILLSIRANNEPGFLTVRQSQQLKGLAILAVFFSHIGYFLASDQRFLYPLSTLAGVGVNIFLVLSGFGLTTSALAKTSGVWEFYRKRIQKIYLPVWVVMAIFLVLDYFVLRKSYPLDSVIKGFVGFFPRANLYVDLNSPLWYFTFITFFYLVFPWLFVRKTKWLAPLVLLLISYAILQLPLPVDAVVLGLYKLHYWGFPLGMLLALAGPYLAKCLQSRPVKVLTIPLLAAIIVVTYYTAINSNIGQGNLEQLSSIITTLGFIGIVGLIKFKVGFLKIMGDYSYEIYLLHWPLMYSYDFLYSRLSPAVATFLYLLISLALGWLLQKLVSFLAGGLAKEPRYQTALKKRY